MFRPPPDQKRQRPEPVLARCPTISNPKAKLTCNRDAAFRLTDQNLTDRLDFKGLIGSGTNSETICFRDMYNKDIAVRDLQIAGTSPFLLLSREERLSMGRLNLFRNTLQLFASSLFKKADRLIQTAITVLTSLILAMLFSLTAIAEEHQIIRKGDMAVTGFSGTSFPEEGLSPGINPLDETFINGDGVSLRIFDVRNFGQPPQGQLVTTPPPFEVKASQIGQVFGLAFDDGKREDSAERIPNLYATASSFHGLQIVGADTDGDGRPERLQIGQADAQFMDGQWGTSNGGTPGAIWKIDGRTGEVSLFANVTLNGKDNSGPGLGNIAFDRLSRQLFVSDLDTGKIHRFDLAGNDLGTFDHGQAGRPSKGLAPVADDDADRMDITNASFKADDPTSWGLTSPERRVYGLGVKGRRLFYAVQNQIWSVAILNDGSFGEAQWELDVNSETSHQITDIAFDNKGFLYLAERGLLQNKYDYSQFAVPEKSRVLRYFLESPDDPATPSRWVEVPQDYSVGFHDLNQMGLGGIDLQYGYDAQGQLDFGACDITLLKTGDNLRDNPALADQLSPGGPFHVHGVQHTHKDLVRPANTPPWQSYFTDFDSKFDDGDARGQVGDVEVYRPCEGIRTGERWPVPPEELPPGNKRCVVVEAIDYWCSFGGQLGVDLYLKETAGIGADSLKAQSMKPGVTVDPMMQTRAASSDPFELNINGTVPGEHFDLAVCLYNKADSEKGGTFPCCKAVLPMKTPPFACLP